MATNAGKSSVAKRNGWYPDRSLGLPSRLRTAMPISRLLWNSCLLHRHQNIGFYFLQQQFFVYVKEEILL